MKLAGLALVVLVTALSAACVRTTTGAAAASGAHGAAAAPAKSAVTPVSTSLSKAVPSYVSMGGSPAPTLSTTAATTAPIAANTATPNPAAGGIATRLVAAASFPPGVAFAPASPYPSGGLTSDGGLSISGGTIQATVTDAKGPIVGAVARVYGSTLAVATSDATGKVTLGPLAVASGYRLVVTAPGHLTANVLSLGVQKDTITAIAGTLGTEATVSGRVLAGGTPVAGAVVSDLVNSTETGADGTYTLSGVDPTSATVTLVAGRVQYSAAQTTLEVSAKACTAPDLIMTALTPSIYLDFEGADPTQYAGLRAHLTAQGWNIATTPPAHDGVWAIFCANAVPSTATLTTLQNYVASGGKLVLIGEWGGVATYNPVAMDMLGHVVGLNFDPDLIRAGSVPVEAFAATLFVPPAAGGTAQLYGACSVFGLPPMQTLARSDNTAYRVEDFGGVAPLDVAVGGPFGAGRAIAIGDASMFSDKDDDGDGVSNLATGDNTHFIDEILTW